MGMTDENSGIVIDRSRITHKQAKQASLLQIKAKRAQRDFDLEAARECFEEVDRFLEQIVAGVPEGWLPKGVKIGDAGWLDALRQDHYEEIMAEGNADQPGKKTD